MKIWILGSLLMLASGAANYVVASVLLETDLQNYLNMSRNFYGHSLALAEWCAERGIRANTVENIRKAYPEMTEAELAHRQAQEFGWLYGHYAWILRKKGQAREARAAMARAVEYKTVLDAEDYFRLGAIDYGNGELERGWDHVTQALLMDARIEERDLDYRAALEAMVREKFAADPPAFVAAYRRDRVESAPNLSLQTLAGEAINLADKRGQVLFVAFFSPACGTCRLVIAHLGGLYSRFARREEVDFLFVLNQPRLQQQAPALFAQSGSRDLIPGEPATWIVDSQGKVAAKFLGFDPGHEAAFQRKLVELVVDL